MTKVPTIRYFQSQDYEGWLPLWLGYLRFYEATIPQRTTELTWTRLLEPVEPMFGLLALIDDQPVGMAHCILHRSCWTEGDYCYLQDLFVTETARGSGIGRQLIEKVYLVAREKGCSRVHWLTKEENREARHLYDRVADLSGFIQYRKLFEPLT